MEKKKYALLAEWGWCNRMHGLYPKVVETEKLWEFLNRVSYTTAWCIEEATETFVRCGYIKRREKPVSVETNKGQFWAMYQFTDYLKYLAR